MRFEVVAREVPAEVFAKVAVFDRISEWDPFVRHSEVSSGELAELGSRYRLTGPFGLTLEYEIQEVLVPERVVYRGGTKRVTSTDTISVDAVGDGTRVVVESKLEFSGWTVLISSLVLAGVWFGGRFVSVPAMKRHLRL